VSAGRMVPQLRWWTFTSDSIGVKGHLTPASARADWT
jgi:hypothetical protein